jgi:hypothetical protein
MAKTVIRCKIERDGGTQTSIGSTAYHFKPRPNLGAPAVHVAEVEDKRHIARFLSISEAYELFLGEDEDDAPAAVAPAVPDDEPAAPVDPEPAPEPDPEPEAPEAEEEGAADAENGVDVDMSVPLDEQGDDTLRAIYTRLNDGRAPRSNARRETLIAKIEEMLEEQA